MKKSLVIISYAFIFLLIILIVSIGLWGGLTGNVLRKGTETGGVSPGGAGIEKPTLTRRALPGMGPRPPQIKLCSITEKECNDLGCKWVINVGKGYTGCSTLPVSAGRTCDPTLQDKCNKAKCLWFDTDVAAINEFICRAPLSQSSTTSQPPTTSTAGCTNDCSTNGAKKCSSSTGYITCGNYDVDPCTEWSSATSCPASQNCVGGNCVSTNVSNQTTGCTNECSTNGATQCIGSGGYKTCGNYDADLCLELSSSETSCPGSETCFGGACVPSAGTCTDSDGGINYNIQGTVVFNSPSSSGSATDYCTSSSVLRENSCGGGSGLVLTVEYHTCPNGCSNGVCLP